MKTNNYSSFSEHALRDWENSDGVNFAIALARITGWLLHVDWLRKTLSEKNVENMKSLRVYVGDNTNHIYDFRDIFTRESFNSQIILPLTLERGADYGCGSTRYYSESKLKTLPLRMKPEESKIKISHELIINNKEYLSRIPKRQMSNLPAHIAAEFTYGLCNPFATALSDLTGYKPIALIATEYNQMFELGNLGYIHSFTIDKNGNAFDIWGKDTIDNIVKRFELKRYKLDENEHFKEGELFKRNLPVEYEKYYQKSIAIIQEFFI